MEGRDICTVVFPSAEVKVFLDASVSERARRRHEDFLTSGIESNYEEIKEALEKRDFIDRNKEVGALKPAKESILIDSTNMTIEEVVDKIIEIVESRKNVCKEQ